MIRKDNILSLQNPILKIFICLVLIIISSIISFDKFLIIFGYTLFYLIISPTIYIIWLKTLMKITPFFISLYIFGILFQISFVDQCFLSARIIHILLISVYLVETSSIDSFISWNKSNDSEFWFKFKFFLVATVHFIPILTIKFKKNRKSHKNIVDIIVLSMEDCLKEIYKVEKTVINEMEINNEQLKVAFWANFYLLLLVLIPSLFIFINYLLG
ncbi:MAG: hypothetical protein U9P73_10785 [Candidatus Cloacimonadota bacterium]|nr:hypothetical protein [Candidatus Cloacimonadota bacterium]